MTDRDDNVRGIERRALYRENLEFTHHAARTGIYLNHLGYRMIKPGEMPDFAFATHNVPCMVNPLGVKGAGEAGAIGSCPAVMNAILDALWRAYGIRHIDMPASPQRVWQAIEDAKRKQ